MGQGADRPWDEINAEVWSFVFRRYRYVEDLPVTVEQIAQHVVIQLWQEAERGNSKEHPTAWKAVVAANYVRSEIKRRNRRREVSIEPALDDGGEREDCTRDEMIIRNEIYKKSWREFQEKSREDEEDGFEDSEFSDEGPIIGRKPESELSEALPRVWLLTRKEKLYYLSRILPGIWRVEEYSEYMDMALEELAGATGQSKGTLILLCEKLVAECIRERGPNAKRAKKLSTEAIRSLFPEDRKPSTSSINKTFSLAKKKVNGEVPLHDE